MSELRELIEDRYTPIDLVDKLDMSMEDFLDCVWDYIIDNIDKLEDEFEVDGELYE